MLVVDSNQVRTNFLQTLNEAYTAAEIIVLRTGALVLLAIYVYKTIRKHWRSP